MNFFKSVFADEPDPPNPDSDTEPGSPRSQDPDPTPQPDPDPNPSAVTGWNFGDLIKTIATKSETVIETYRRDLQEFGSGLKKEIEVAQGSLETVGTKIDELGTTVLQGTAQMISQGILAADHESDSSDSTTTTQGGGGGGLASQMSMNSKRYSRFESQLRAIQGDVSTYVEEAEEAEEYGRWRAGFALEEKREEIEGLLEGNGAMEAVYKRVSPSVVDDETFWSRYYFRVYKLKQAEDVRANLVKRAISVEVEDELSWDVDDEEEEYEESGSNVGAKSGLGKSGEGVKSDGNEGSSSSVADEANVAAKAESVSRDSEQKAVEDVSPAEELQGGESSLVDDEKKESVVESSGDKETEKKVNVDGDSKVPSKSEEEKKVNVEGDSKVPSKFEEEKKVKVEGDSKVPSKSEEEKKVNVEGDSGKKDLPSKSEEKEALEVKSEVPVSSKESGVSAASVGPSAGSEEEDLGWDEIEDLSSIDEKRDEKRESAGASGGNANRAELQKRLSTAEEEEDLSWDIDDDDEPAKA